MPHRTTGTVVLAFCIWGLGTPSASAQQALTDVLTFLVTNRSIATDDFVRDEQAALATRDTVANLLVLELATLPSSSTAGFTYRLDPALGTMIRSSDSFGPLFTERALTPGRRQASFGMSFRSTSYSDIDGRDLRNGTLLSTASILRGEAAPFDVETVSLKIRTDAMTFTGSVGITDRISLSAGIPFVRVSLQGQRVDNYRGRTLLQAAASASSSGFGDVVVRGKVGLVNEGASGLALGAEVRLPTGSEENLLGAGRAAFTPRLIGSYEGSRIGVHSDIGYAFDPISEGFSYTAAATVAAAPRLTLVGEMLGRTLRDLGSLAETTQPNPRLVGVDTIRLTNSGQSTNRIVVAAGFKWNVASTWLVTASVLRSLTTVGLNANWVPNVTFDYWFRD